MGPTGGHRERTEGSKIGGSLHDRHQQKKADAKAKFLRPRADNRERPIQSLAPKNQSGLDGEKVPEQKGDRGDEVALSQEIWPHRNTWQPGRQLTPNKG